MRVLIADDSTIMRKILRKALAGLNEESLEVIEAKDGAEAFELLRNDQLDLDVALLDWNMPNLDGIGVLKALRALRPPRAIPVMMVTSQAQKAHVGEALRWGARDYVVKPFTEQIIREKVLKLRSQAEVKKCEDTSAFLRIMAAESSGSPGSAPTLRLPEEVLEAMKRVGKVQAYPEGEGILRSDSPVHQFLVILSGEVDVKGRDGSVGVRGAGESLAELGFLRGHLAQLEARARTPVLLVSLSRSQVGDLGRAHPALNRYLGSKVITRMAPPLAPSAERPAPSVEEKDPGFRGNLETMPICDLVQVLSVCQKTGRLSLVRSGVEASFYFIQGELVHASLLDLAGAPAFFKALEWTKAEFTFKSGESPRERTVLQPTMTLLMEGSRRLDEAQRRLRASAEGGS